MIKADALALDGGLAAAWAAAAQADAAVVLADKGRCGASGVIATAGVSGRLGWRRRDPGRHDPAHANENWRTDEVSARARSLPPQETSP